MVLLSGVHSSERSFDKVHLLCFAPLPKDRVSVLSNSSYTAAALTDDNLSPTLSTAAATWLCVASLVFSTTSRTSGRRTTDRTFASSCWYGPEPALDPMRNPTPSPSRNDNFFTIWPFSEGFDLQCYPVPLRAKQPGVVRVVSCGEGQFGALGQRRWPLAIRYPVAFAAVSHPVVWRTARLRDLVPF